MSEEKTPVLTPTLSYILCKMRGDMSWFFVSDVIKICDDQRIRGSTAYTHMRRLCGMGLVDERLEDVDARETSRRSPREMYRINETGVSRVAGIPAQRR